MNRSGYSVPKTRLLPREKRTFRLSRDEVTVALEQYVVREASIEAASVDVVEVVRRRSGGILSDGVSYFEVTLTGRTPE